MARHSHTRRLVEVLMSGQGQPLEAFVRERRALGVPWRRITLDVNSRTGMDLNPDTLQRWFPDEDEAA